MLIPIVLHIAQYPAFDYFNSIAFMRLYLLSQLSLRVFLTTQLLTFMHTHSYLGLSQFNHSLLLFSLSAFIMEGVADKVHYEAYPAFWIWGFSNNFSK